MKPVPNSILLLLLLALCGLCAWQWHEENLLRGVIIRHQQEVIDLTDQRYEAETHAKAADAEILRLTGSLTELRTNSVSKQQHDETTAAATAMREAIEKQNATIKEQNETLVKANAAIQQANENIKKLTEERDALAKRINDVTAKYNELAKKGGS